MIKKQNIRIITISQLIEYSPIFRLPAPAKKIFSSMSYNFWSTSTIAAHSVADLLAIL